MNEKFIKVSCILLIVIGFSFIFINSLLYSFANDFAEEHDLIYKASKTPLADLTVDGDELSGITRTYGNLIYFDFTTKDGKKPKIEDHIMETFKLKIINVIDTFNYVKGMIIFIGFFLTIHLYKFNRTKFGAILTFFVGVFTLFFGVLDGLQYLVCGLLIISSVLVYRNEEVLRGRGLPFWHYL